MAHKNTTNEYLVVAKKDWETVQRIVAKYPECLAELQAQNIKVTPITVDGGSLADLFREGGHIEVDARVK